MDLKRLIHKIRAELLLGSQVRFLRKTGLIAEDWYREHYKFTETPFDAVFHYLKYGADLGLNPNPFFDTKFYLAENEDVARSGVNPLLHYFIHGAHEARNPHPMFITSRYIEAHPGVDFKKINALKHFVDSKSALQNDSEHEYELIATEFDRDFYLSQWSPSDSTDSVYHFISEGWRQGLDPTKWFSVHDYLRLYPDVAAAKSNPFYHYLRHGRLEGRIPRAIMERNLKINEELEPILFVGHDGIKAGAQTVLLEIVRWYAEHTRRPLFVLLLNGGQLASAYSKYAMTFVLHEGNPSGVLNGQFVKFIRKKFAFVYVNTVASGDFCAIYDNHLKDAETPLILHVHELSNVIQEYYTGFKELAARASMIIAVSEAVRCCLIQEYECDADYVYLSNAFIRPLCRTPKEFYAARKKARKILEIDDAQPLVMGCGSVIDRKGPDLFLDVASKIISGGPGANTHFIWLGTGPRLEEMRAATAEKKLTDKVSFIGFHEEAAVLLAAADVFFLSSREDPFPLVCLEAAQYGIPSVFFQDATSISEFTGKDAGLGVENFDVDQAAFRIISLLHFPFLRMKLGTAAQERVLSEYNYEVTIRKVAAVIQKIAKVTPEISVVVPAYNHEVYIGERIESILGQTIQDFEVILLDDCSSDNTIQAISPYLSDLRLKLIRNEKNSGSPFKQWKIGLNLAKAPIVWIAEGDDSVEKHFLETLVPAFDDASVTLAFCPSVIIDSYGERKENALLPYYAQSSFPFDNKKLLVDGFEAIELGFGSMCLIVNASSALMRTNLAMLFVDNAVGFKICGDWLVYLHCLTKGKLFYSNETENYFRRHTESTVHKFEGTAIYFEERYKISEFVIQNFNISRGLFQCLNALNENEWHRFRERNPGAAKEDHLHSASLRLLRKERWKFRPMRIGLYVHGMLFSRGGIEKLATEIANSLSRRGHTIFVFCRVWESATPVFPLNASVRLIPAFDECDIENSIRRLRLELAKSDLDCFVPMLSEWLFEPIVEAAGCLGVPILVSEHNDPWKIEELWWPKSKRIACFESITRIHLLIDRYKNSLPSSLQRKVSIIPNGIRVNNEIITTPAEGRRCRFICVGRLEPQKRYDRVIKAFRQISHELPDWRLDIFGEGSERTNLLSLIDKLLLSDRVVLRGKSSMVLGEMINSAIFVIPSEFEGFPIVLLEAKMAGLPTVGYKDCSGVKDIIRPEIDGILVEPDDDGENLANGMYRLAIDENFRVGMASQARENIWKFEIETIIDKWEELLDDVASETRPRAPST